MFEYIKHFQLWERILLQHAEIPVVELHIQDVTEHIFQQGYEEGLCAYIERVDIVRLLS